MQAYFLNMLNLDIHMYIERGGKEKTKKKKIKNNLK